MKSAAGGAVFQNSSSRRPSTVTTCDSGSRTAATLLRGDDTCDWACTHTGTRQALLSARIERWICGRINAQVLFSEKFRVQQLRHQAAIIYDILMRLLHGDDPSHTMNTLASGIGFADLDFQGLHRIIATATLQGADGVTVVDPGPSSTLAGLRRHLASIGASVRDVSALFITHIHLDHAGATGTLLRENPRIKVYVHEIGAPHMVDPSRLLASAGRCTATAWSGCGVKSHPCLPRP